MLHHDLACHRTSPTHCQACNASPAASPTEKAPAVDRAELRVAGTVEVRQERARAAAASLRVPARPPPA